MTQLEEKNKISVVAVVGIIFAIFLLFVSLGCSDSKERKSIISEAKSCIDSENYTLAVSYLEYYIDRYKDSSEAWKLLGISYASQGSLDKANSCFTSAIELEPADPTSYAYLGQIMRIKGEYQRAIGLFKKSCDMGSGEACRMLIGAITENANQGYMSPGEVLQYRRNRPRSLNDYYNQ